jgi:hypothetical protein
MYFWDMRKLVDKLAKNQVNEKQIFCYFFIQLLIVYGTVELTRYFGNQTPNFWAIVDSVVFLAISAIGTWACFRANNGASGTDFLPRYISISFVASIRFMVLLIPIFAGLWLYWNSAFEPDVEPPVTPQEVLVLSTWYGLLNLYMVKQMKLIASKALS